MASTLERPETIATEHHPDDRGLDEFLAQLSELSRRFGLAIGDGAYLYVMEPEDYARAYTASDESALSFA